MIAAVAHVLDFVQSRPHMHSACQRFLMHFPALSNNCNAYLMVLLRALTGQGPNQQLQCFGA